MKKEISIQTWYKPGGSMMYRCDALEPDHPMHPYNQALAQGVVPEDFGIANPFTSRYKKMSRQDLERRLYELEQELEAYARFGVKV